MASAPVQSSAASRRDRPDPFSRPLDAFLQQLREARLPYVWSDDLRVWWSICPSCRYPGWMLRVREGVRGGQITLMCCCGCSEEEIRKALSTAQTVSLEAQRDAALNAAESAREVAVRALGLAAAQARGELPEVELKVAA